MTRVIFFCGLLLSIQHPRQFLGDEVPEKVQTHPFVMELIGPGPVHVGNFSFGKVAPGEVQEAVILVQNATNDEIALEKVELSCKCTTAKVPKIVLERGKEIALTFRIETSAQPRFAEENFSAIVTYSGKNIIKFNFSARYSGLVAFTQHELNVDYSSADRQHSFRLPLECESDELIDKVNIETSPELKSIKTSIVREKDRFYVECIFSPADLQNAEVLGEIIVLAPSGLKSSVLCRLRERKSLEILPARIVFTVGETSDVPRQAVAIIRIRPFKSDAALPNILSISCRSPQDVELKSAFTQLSKSVYRVTIQSASNEDILSDGLLKWLIKTDLGQEIRVESQCLLSN